MTVNQIGRPSKAPERMAQILRATGEIVARDGLAGVTFAKVAEAAGLQRTLVLHYFGSREELVTAFIDEAMGAVGTEILGREADASLRQRLPLMFGPDAYRERDDLVVWTELKALAARDASVRRIMRDLWRNRWLPDVEAQLRHDFPRAKAEAVSATTYALACLFEGHWALSLQDVVDEARHHQAAQAALLILDGLER